MSRSISAAARAALYSQQTGEVFLELIEIGHVDLAEPLRFVYNTEAVIHGGDTYYPAAFRYEQAGDVEGQARSARLTIDNVDRQIVETIRTISSPPEVVAKVVLASSPDTIEVGPYSYILREVSYNAHTVSGELYDGDQGQIAVPGLTYTPYDFPGLYP